MNYGRLKVRLTLALVYGSPEITSLKPHRATLVMAEPCETGVIHSQGQASDGSQLETSPAAAGNPKASDDKRYPICILKEFGGDFPGRQLGVAANTASLFTTYTDRIYSTDSMCEGIA